MNNHRDPVVAGMRERETAFEQVWQRQFVEPFNKKYSALPLYDTESAERYVRRAVRFLLTGSVDGPFPGAASQPEISSSQVMKPWEREPDPCWSCGGAAEARDDIHVRCMDTKNVNCEVMNHWYTRKTWNTRASSSSQVVKALKEATTSALEWFAGFPHSQGSNASAFELLTATDVYNELARAIALADEQENEQLNNERSNAEASENTALDEQEKTNEQ